VVVEASGSPVHGTAGDGPQAILLEASYAHLRELGLASADAPPAWRLLGGGVSNWVILFDCGEGVVVKAALARLRVREEWLADPSRTALEGRAMAALGACLPRGDLPRVLFVDEARHCVGMSYAPPGSYPWKEALLRGEVDTHVAHQVGALLGRMHAAAWGDADLARRFDDLALFHQLRLDPYHARAAQIAEQRGEEDVAALLRAGAAEMTQDRVTLVHGDFSPKNLLVHPGGVMALDFEVVHWGNPDFDTAFLLTHLTLKAAHRPVLAPAYEHAARIFLVAYTATLSRRPADEVAGGALRQAGCLLVARVDGKSPAEYLDAAGRARARALGVAILRGTITAVPDLFGAVQAL
jgi:tRNA A-37 threonylcarbamoyl transferase component Bud32